MMRSGKSRVEKIGDKSDEIKQLIVSEVKEQAEK